MIAAAPLITAGTAGGVAATNVGGNSQLNNPWSGDLNINLGVFENIENVRYNVFAVR
jgi:hypothetical protein